MQVQSTERRVGEAQASNTCFANGFPKKIPTRFSHLMKLACPQQGEGRQFEGEMRNRGADRKREEQWKWKELV